MMMELSEKMQGIVANAVIEALGGESSAIVKEMIDEVMNKKVGEYDSFGYHGYASRLLAGYARGGDNGIPYVEYLAREAIREGIASAVQDWFKANKKALKKQVAERINADRIADDYVGELETLFANGHFSVSTTVSRTRDDD